MHFEIARKDLINPLKTAVGVVEQRQIIPILGNALIRVEKGNLFLTTTDAEVEIACKIILEEPNLDDSDDGAITLPARKLFEICRSLPSNAQLDFTTVENETPPTAAVPPKETESYKSSEDEDEEESEKSEDSEDSEESEDDENESLDDDSEESEEDEDESDEDSEDSDDEDSDEESEEEEDEPLSRSGFDYSQRRKKDEGKIIVKSGKSRFTLATLPAEDYPNTPEIDSVFSFTIPQSVLKRLLVKTQFSMAQNDARYYLNGMLIDLLDDTISLVATDGHRLSVAVSELDMNGQEPIQVILPKKAVVELIKMLAENDDDEVSIDLDNNHIRITTPDGTIMSSKLIDGRYPDYRAVIPVVTSDTKTVIAKCEPLKQALSRVSILNSDNYKGTRLTLTKDMLKMNSRNSSQEESEEILDVDYSDEKFEIGFNSSYLFDVINVIDTESVELHFTDTNSSCLITPRDSDELKYVVMPMRL